MRTVIIVQARMTSTRLPGKILKNVLDRSLLFYQVERLRCSKLADDIVIATTINDTDQPVVDFCRRERVAFFRGSEEDVLSRYYEAAKEYCADVVVRVTSDCPLIDPMVIDKVIGYFLEHQEVFDYVSNVIQRTYPRGMDTEVFSFNILKEAHREAVKPMEREHVTPFIHMQPERYRLGHVVYAQNQSRYRWTVDTKEDFMLIEKIISELYPKKKIFTMEDCLQLLEKNPDWENINAHIEQKKI